MKKGQEIERRTTTEPSGFSQWNIRAPAPMSPTIWQQQESIPVSSVVRTCSFCLPPLDKSGNAGAGCESNTSLIPASPPDMTHLEELQCSSEAASWSATPVKYALSFLDEAAPNFGGKVGKDAESYSPSFPLLLQPRATPTTWRQATWCLFLLQSVHRHLLSPH